MVIELDPLGVGYQAQARTTWLLETMLLYLFRGFHINQCRVYFSMLCNSVLTCLLLWYVSWVKFGFIIHISCANQQNTWTCLSRREWVDFFLSTNVQLHEVIHCKMQTYKDKQSHCLLKCSYRCSVLWNFILMNKSLKMLVKFGNTYSPKWSTWCEAWITMKYIHSLIDLLYLGWYVSTGFVSLVLFMHDRKLERAWEQGYKHWAF